MAAHVLLLALRGRDAAVIAQILARQAIVCDECRSVGELAASLDDEVSAVIVTEESLEDVHSSGLLTWLENQPAWSDLPFILLATRRVGKRPKDAATVLERLGNVILLERPIHSDTLLRAVDSALRGRRRQWEARRHLADLKSAEERLTQLNNSLEHLIAERTSELSRANDRLTQEIAQREQAQSALVQSQKMEAIGQLTGGIAHDFNNLLTVICGNLDMIQRSATDERTATQASHALQAADRAAKLTQQLLVFSRTQKLTLEPIDVNALISGTSNLLERTIGADAKVELRFDAANPWTRADKNQLELAILNLAINARDAMPAAGDIVISSSVEEGAFPGIEARRFAVISVQDSGPGIPPHLIEKVFDPFFTTKPVGKGTGLGLSQVYGIAQQSGGLVRIENREESGANVSIWLPLASPQVLVKEGGRPKLAVAAGSAHTVVVVEDDPGVRQFIVESLRGAGFKVVEAANGIDALSLLQSRRPDLLLVDFAMPGMNGADLAQAAWAIHDGLPVVMATGYADMNKVEKVLPAERVLRKPFRTEDLVRAISEAIPGGDATRAGIPEHASDEE
jgi:signal transduction histidine kinase/ActR/RegA family two-component response regulator